MVATWHPFCLSALRNRPSPMPFPSSGDYLITVLAVKGLLRRAVGAPLTAPGRYEERPHKRERPGSESITTDRIS